MKKVFIFLVSGVLLTNFICAQATLFPVGANYFSLGTYRQHNLEVFATRSNPATLAGLDRAAVSAYGENRFLVDGLGMYTASVGLPTKSGNFGLHGVYFGSGLSNQSQIILGYGRKIGTKIDVGASFHFEQIKQSGIYGSSAAITGSVGIALHLSDEVNAGVSMYNPIRMGYNKQNLEKLPSRYSFGLGYQPSKVIFVSGELVKEEGQNLNVNFGFQYQFVKQVFIRGGIATQSKSYFGGLGFLLKDFRLDIVTSYHPQLGISPGILLLYAFGKNETATEKTALP